MEAYTISNKKDDYQLLRLHLGNYRHSLIYKGMTGFWQHLLALYDKLTLSLTSHLSVHSVNLSILFCRIETSTVFAKCS